MADFPPKLTLLTPKPLITPTFYAETRALYDEGMLPYCAGSMSLSVKVLVSVQA